VSPSLLRHIGTVVLRVCVSSSLGRVVLLRLRFLCALLFFWLAALLIFSGGSFDCRNASVLLPTGATSAYTCLPVICSFVRIGRWAGLTVA